MIRVLIDVFSMHNVIYIVMLVSAKWYECETAGSPITKFLPYPTNAFLCSLIIFEPRRSSDVKWFKSR